MTIDISTDSIDGVPSGTKVVVTGNIDASTTATFSEQVDQLERDGTRHYVFDLEGVKYIASHAMIAMVKAADRTVSNGGSFVLIGMHPKTKIVFESLGLDNFFKVFTNLPRAQEYILEMIDGAGAAVASARPRTKKKAPAATRRRAVAPAPVAPTPGRGRISSANVPTAGAEPQGDNVPKAFIVMAPSMPHQAIIGNFIQAACGGAGIAAARMDATKPQQNQAALQQCHFVICDLTGHDELAIKVATAARNMKPAKQVICLVQGSKADLPEQFRNLPTVPYHASQQGMQYLKRYLEGGLKQLAARIRR